MFIVITKTCFYYNRALFCRPVGSPAQPFLLCDMPPSELAHAEAWRWTVADSGDSHLSPPGSLGAGWPGLQNILNIRFPDSPCTGSVLSSAPHPSTASLAWGTRPQITVPPSLLAVPSEALGRLCGMTQDGEPESKLVYDLWLSLGAALGSCNWKIWLGCLLLVCSLNPLRP